MKKKVNRFSLLFLNAFLCLYCSTCLPLLCSSPSLALMRKLFKGKTVLIIFVSPVNVLMVTFTCQLD